MPKLKPTALQFWMNLQARYDLKMQKDVLGDWLAKVPALKAA